ncbi:MAG TPA: hypothetical protein VJT73_21125, partial [Polyangiaceae bacterium]|nr:hypothetical protein [Polyangiaceae bacterium]
AAAKKRCLMPAKKWAEIKARRDITPERRARLDAEVAAELLVIAAREFRAKAHAWFAQHEGGQ